MLVADAVATWLAVVSPDVRIVTDEASPRAFAVTPLPHGIALTIGPPRLARLIGAVTVALVAASLLSGWTFGHWQAPYRLHRLFDLDRETNVPTWWSAMLLLATGVVACFQASTDRRSGNRRWVDWLTLGALFVALATDEAAGLHELLVKPLRALLGSGGWLHYPLIVPGTVVGIVVAIRFRGFLRTLGPTRRRLAASAAVFALGALGFETVGGWYAPDAIGPNATYVALSTIEETLEMLGSTLALLALLRHVREWRMPPSAADRSWLPGLRQPLADFRRRFEVDGVRSRAASRRDSTRTSRQPSAFSSDANRSALLVPATRTIVRSTRWRAHAPAT